MPGRPKMNRVRGCDVVRLLLLVAVSWSSPAAAQQEPEPEPEPWYYEYIGAAFVMAIGVSLALFYPIKPHEEKMDEHAQAEEKAMKEKAKAMKEKAREKKGVKEAKQQAKQDKKEANAKGGGGRGIPMAAEATSGDSGGEMSDLE